MNICWNLQSSFHNDTYNLGARYHFKTVQVHNNSLYELLSHLKAPGSLCYRQLLHEYKTKNIQIFKLKKLSNDQKELQLMWRNIITKGPSDQLCVNRSIKTKNDLELRAEHKWLNVIYVPEKKSKTKINHHLDYGVMRWFCRKYINRS